MFAIGDKEWPGISKLIEEAGEVQQVCGKLMGTRGAENHWDGTNLKVRLEQEIADLMAACNFVVTHCGLDPVAVSKRITDKVGTFDNWHESGLRGCNHGITFDYKASHGLEASEIKKRWPRLSGTCPKGCGYHGIYYASYEHYIMGDW
jgi:NTP pyrophosphatase (non-canonical NTP hydrolase)